MLRRIHGHRTGVTGGFTSKYGCKRLSYFELFETMRDAITRGKQLTGGSRARKIALIEATNPGWRDL